MTPLVTAPCARNLLIASMVFCAQAHQSAAQAHSVGGTIDGLVTDTSLAPLASVTVSVLGSSVRVVTGNNGRFRIADVPPGQYSLLARRIGFAAAAATVVVLASETQRISVYLQPATTSLDTIRVTGRDDPTGFETRRRGPVGQFITAADIIAEKPPSATTLLRTRDGLRQVFDKSGNPYITMFTGPSPAGACSPDIVVDGFPANSILTVTGVPNLNWAIHPEDIGGVEIYNDPAMVPPQFSAPSIRGRPGFCGVIVFWTREKLGLPTITRANPLH
jgi:hypothetical protein